MSNSAANPQNPSGFSPGGATDNLKPSTLPRPENPPPPTFWPFITAVGLMICFWGIELDLLVVSVGGGVFIIGIAGLIGDWVREHRHKTI
jgi:hypothetical protein